MDTTPKGRPVERNSPVSDCNLLFLGDSLRSRPGSIPRLWATGLEGFKIDRGVPLGFSDHEPLTVEGDGSKDRAHTKRTVTSQLSTLVHMSLDRTVPIVANAGSECSLPLTGEDVRRVVLCNNGPWRYPRLVEPRPWFGRVVYPSSPPLAGSVGVGLPRISLPPLPN